MDHILPAFLGIIVLKWVVFSEVAQGRSRAGARGLDYLILQSPGRHMQRLTGPKEESQTA